MNRKHATGLTPKDVVGLIGAGTAGLGAIHELNKDPNPDQKGQSPLGRAARGATNAAIGYAVPAAATYGLLSAAGPSAANYPKLSPLLKGLLPAAAGTLGGIMYPNSSAKLAKLKPMKKIAEGPTTINMEQPYMVQGTATPETFRQQILEKMRKNQLTQPGANSAPKPAPKGIPKMTGPGSGNFKTPSAVPNNAPPPTAKAKSTSAPSPKPAAASGASTTGGDAAPGWFNRLSKENPAARGDATPSWMNQLSKNKPEAPGVVGQLSNFLAKQVGQNGLTHGEALGGAALPTLNALAEGGLVPAAGAVAGGYAGGALGRMLSKSTPAGAIGAALGSTLAGKLMTPNQPQMHRYASTRKHAMPIPPGRDALLAKLTQPSALTAPAEGLRKVRMGISSYQPKPQPSLGNALFDAAVKKHAFKQDEKGIMVKKTKCAKCGSMHGPGECGMSMKEANYDFAQPAMQGPTGGFMQMGDMMGGFGSMGSYGDLPPELAMALQQTAPMQPPQVPTKHKAHKKSDNKDEKKSKDSDKRDDKKDDKKEKDASADMSTFKDSFMSKWNGATFESKMELFRTGAQLMRKSIHDE